MTKIKGELSTPLIESGSLALLEGEQILAVGTANRISVAFFDAETLKYQYRVRTSEPTSQMFTTKNGKYLVAFAVYGYMYKKGWGYEYARSNEVFVLDGRTGDLKHRVKVGENLGVAVDLGDDTIVISSVQSKRIARVDLNTGKVLDKSYTRGFNPGYVATRSDNQIGIAAGGVYQQGSSSRAIGTKLLFFDPMAIEETQRFEYYKDLGHPRGLLFHPDGQHVLVADAKRKELVIVDWVNHKIKEFKTLNGAPELFVQLPDGEHALIGYKNTNLLSRINLRTGFIETITIPGKTHFYNDFKPQISRLS